MKVKRKIIQIDEEKCDGCGLCVPSCAEGAIQVIDGKAKLLAEKYCDGLGACLGECPKDALHIMEKEVEEFDVDAVEEHLKKGVERTEQAAPRGCPSAQVQQFDAAPAASGGGVPSSGADEPSALRNWPVQIRLVPASAPYLKGADLLVAADCTAVAFAGFHRHLLRGRAVLMGCPKFDDLGAYVQKFTNIFKTADIQSVTVAVMEVPCCQGLPMVVERGMELAGKKIPIKKVVIGVKGDLLTPVSR